MNKLKTIALHGLLPAVFTVMLSHASYAMAQPVNLAVSYLTISSTTTFEATNSITAGPNVNILSGANVTFHVVNTTSSTGIILKPGFTATTGCTFRAYIGSGTASAEQAGGPATESLSKSDTAETSKATDEEIDAHLKGTAEMDAVPQEFSLAPNSPNPFNPSTTLKYELPQQAEVRLKIFDVQGRHVRTLVDQSQPAGRYAIMWDGRNEQGQAVASGTFFYQLRAVSSTGSPSTSSPSTGSGFVKTRRMVLVR